MCVCVGGGGGGGEQIISSCYEPVELEAIEGCYWCKLETAAVNWRLACENP